MKRINIVIVGHVDHGKSTLIGRLFHDTGSIPATKMGELKYIAEALNKPLDFALIMDNLKEERDGGITIDTSQIPFKSVSREYTIIDAPGHVEFTKNMLTGASYADAAVLMVDVAEGIQEQTRRHAYLLSFLGINEVILAINKMDKIEWNLGRLTEVRLEAVDLLGSLGIEPSATVVMSARDGDGVVKPAEAKQWTYYPTLLQALDAVELPKLEEQPFRMCVQGKRDVVAYGQVLSGKLTEDTCAYSMDVGRIDLTPLNAEGTAAGLPAAVMTHESDAGERGDVLAECPLPRCGSVLNAKVFWLGEEPGCEEQQLRLRCSTQTTQCVLVYIESVFDPGQLLEVNSQEEIHNGQAAVVQILCDEPITHEVFPRVPELGRFVLEGPEGIVAAGIITE